MKHIVSQLDKIADTLQGAGLIKLAYSIDEISDRLASDASGDTLKDRIQVLTTRIQKANSSSPDLRLVIDGIHDFFHDTNPEHSVFVDTLGRIGAPNKHAIVTLLANLNRILDLKGVKPLEGDEKLVGMLENLSENC
jgi:hypothetical protein